MKLDVSMTAKNQTEKLIASEPRRATHTDRNALVAMYRSFEPKASAMGLPPRNDPRAWLDRLSACPNFVVSVDGRMVGHAVLCAEGDCAEIAVFIHQDYRGRGLGKKLVREAISQARRLGLRRVWMAMETYNVPMRTLARSLGFIPGKEPHKLSLDLCERLVAR